MLRTPTVDPDPLPTWDPIPIELPIDDPFRRPPHPAGGERRPWYDGDDDADGSPGRRVIIIDLKDCPWPFVVHRDKVPLAQRGVAAA